MEGNLTFYDRRAWFRFEMQYPAIYTRFDGNGRECDQKPSRLMNANPAGVGLQSRFLIEPGEVIDVSMALENPLVPLEERLITFMGKVMYLVSCQDRNMRLGIAVERIQDQERAKLNRFIQNLVAFDFEHENRTIKSGQIVCPSCGARIESVVRVKAVVTHYRGFWDHCRCGQRYEVKPDSSDGMVVSFPGMKLEVVC